MDASHKNEPIKTRGPQTYIHQLLQSSESVGCKVDHAADGLGYHTHNTLAETLE
jgi:hypothetical protein